MKLCSIVTVAALVAFVGVANAAIVPIGPFTGMYQDSWETQPRGQFLPHYDMWWDGSQYVGDVYKFGGGSQGLHITTGWGYYYTVYPRSGEVFMGPTSNLGARYEFDVPAIKFGGYFCTNYQSSGATATFYDENNNVLAVHPVKAPAGNSLWTWDGWEVTGGPPMAAVEIVSDYGAGHIMNDDLEFTPIPEPATLSLLALAGLALLRRR